MDGALENSLDGGWKSAAASPNDRGSSRDGRARAGSSWSRAGVKTDESWCLQLPLPTARPRPVRSSRSTRLCPLRQFAGRHRQTPRALSAFATHLPIDTNTLDQLVRWTVDKSQPPARKPRRRRVVRARARGVGPGLGLSLPVARLAKDELTSTLTRPVCGLAALNAASGPRSRTTRSRASSSQAPDERTEDGGRGGSFEKPVVRADRTALNEVGGRGWAVRAWPS